MASVPGGVNPPPPDLAADLRRWRGALAAGLLLCAAFLALSSAEGSLNDFLYIAGELLATAAIPAGVRHYRPPVPAAWLLIAGGLSAFLAGDILWTIYEASGIDPFSSAADIFYLAGYPLLAGGLTIATLRRRKVGIDARATIAQRC
jgi:hypothetical protein